MAILHHYNRAAKKTPKPARLVNPSHGVNDQYAPFVRVAPEAVLVPVAVVLLVLLLGEISDMSGGFFPSRKLEPQVFEMVVFSVFEIVQGSSDKIKSRVALEQSSQAVCGGRRVLVPFATSSDKKANAVVRV